MSEYVARRLSEALTEAIAKLPKKSTATQKRMALYYAYPFQRGVSSTSEKLWEEKCKTWLAANTKVEPDTDTLELF